jgi:hypothetical protein
MIGEVTMAKILFVRIKSDLEWEELERRVEDRREVYDLLFPLRPEVGPFEGLESNLTP